MNNPEIDALCQRIYKNHRQALDLIWDRVVGPASGVLVAAAAVLREDPRWHVFYQTNRYIAFVPQTWLAWLPELGLEKDARSWIILRLYLYDDKLEFIVQVRPMRDSTKRKEIVQLLIAELPKLGFIRSGGGKGERTYTRVTGADRVKKWREDEEPEEDAVRVAPKEKLDDIYPRLEGVQSLLKPLVG